MRKLISICFLFFFAVIGNAQTNKKNKFSELNQDQLKLALKDSQVTIKTGATLTIIGLGLIATGVIIMGINSKMVTNTDNQDNNFSIGARMVPAGCISILIGLPVLTHGLKKKDKIMLELKKFNPPGSASINGIGLKIVF
jgi:hypothetical protein